MAARGRPPKPIEILNRQGTSRDDRHAKRAKEPKSGVAIKMPRTLKGDAAKFWKRCFPMLEAMSVTDGVDVFYLERLAIAWANMVVEQKRYDAGETDIYHVGSAWKVFDSIASKFGLSPVDRTKLATSEEPTDVLMEFIRASKN